MTADHSPPGRPAAVREFTALALSVPLAFGTHALIHIGGDQYGGALGLIAVAAVLDYRRRRLWTRTLFYSAVVAFLADWTALQQMLAWTEGVR